MDSRGYGWVARMRVARRDDCGTFGAARRWPAALGIALALLVALCLNADAWAQASNYAYDANGRLVGVTQNDNAAQYRYDANGNLLQISASYDAGNRLTGLLDSSSGATNWTFDGLDRMTSEASAQGNVGYTYDAAGRRTSMTAAAQAIVNYTYDDANRLSTISQGTESVQFAYDADNRRTTLTLPNGMVASYGYDQASQLTSLKYMQANGSVVGDLSYGYDSDGRRVSKGGSFATDVLPMPSTQPAVVDLNGRKTSFNGQTLSYDADGNMTSDGTNTYTWNARNQLVQISQGGVAQLSYGYDALGRRVRKAVQGGMPTGYLYDGANAVQETQGSIVNPMLTGLGVDERFARNDVTGRTYFMTDALGSTIGLADPTGAIKEQYSYDAYGNAALSDTTTGFTNPYQYTGREADSAGLYYYRARYYSPVMAGFISEDPLGFGGGQSSFYAYAGSNPIMFRDPQGKELGLAVIGGLIGGGWGAINGYISGDRGWQLAADIAAGAGTGALAGLTNGASLIELAATRAVASAGIESTRQIANGLMSPCHEVNIHGLGIAFAGIGSLVGDGVGAATGWTAIGERGATALGGFLGGGVSLPEATVEGAEGEEP